jgi:hypothetical protein
MTCLLARATDPMVVCVTVGVGDSAMMRPLSCKVFVFMCVVNWRVAVGVHRALAAHLGRSTEVVRLSRTSVSDFSFTHCCDVCGQCDNVC